MSLKTCYPALTFTHVFLRERMLLKYWYVPSRAFNGEMLLLFMVTSLRKFEMLHYISTKLNFHYPCYHTAVT